MKMQEKKTARQRKTTSWSKNAVQDVTTNVQPRKRLAFIDNLRVVLIILVIAHHTAITYGGPGSWYYTEPTQDAVTLFVFLIFCAVNQSFFMGFFFLISGYFTPGSYDRKRAKSFFKGRLLRLGIPLLAYITVIDPVIRYVLVISLSGYDKPYWRFLHESITHMRGLGTGPLWFVETLLIFAGIYVLWRLFTMSSSLESSTNPPGNTEIALFILLVGVSTFTVRIQLPIGWNFELLNLQFPYFPQYIALFFIGTLAYRRNWFLTLPDSVGKTWGKIALTGVVLLPVMGLLGGAFDGRISLFYGGFHWQAFALALWESFVGIGICIGLLVLFREKYNHQNRLGRTLADNVYTVFIIHAPVLVFCGLALKNVNLYPLVKFALVTLVVVSLCFVISHYVVRRLPYTEKIL